MATADGGTSEESDCAEINKRMRFINNYTINTNEIRMSLGSDINTFTTLYTSFTNCQHILTNIPQSPENECSLKAEKLYYEKQLKTLTTTLYSDITVYTNKLNESLNLLSPIQIHIIDKALNQWKFEQQLAGSGYKIVKNINTIQIWCQKLCDAILVIRSQIKEAERFKLHLIRYFELPQCGIITTLIDMTTQYLSSLMASSFVIVSQPPQVLKTNTRFSMEVHLLIGGRLKIPMPVVKVSIVSESQANAIIGRNKTNDESCGEILNCMGKMDSYPGSGILSINFRSLQLKKIKRSKKGTETVMDEKFSILITSTVVVGNDLRFDLWILSLPVVVIVHGNQEPRACATITWDNAFAQPGRVLFNVSDEVPWGYVANVLSTQFLSATGRGISENCLSYLAEKAFRTNNYISNEMVLSWTKFCKEPLPQRSFSFWEWFYAALKITRDHLKGPWADGTIVGFIQKSYAEQILTNCETGTFLLRFSDSELGGLTVACAGSNNTEAYSLHPFSAKDLSIRNLANRLLDLPYLTKLYPDIDKNRVFGKYYTEIHDVNIPVTHNGYLQPLLVTHVPGLGDSGTNG